MHQKNYSYVPEQLSNKKSIDYPSFPIEPIPRQQYYSKSKQLSQVKYPIRALSQVQQLDSKIQTFKQKQVRQQLKIVLNQFNSYRQVRGDGNCFFRAISFAYYSGLSSSKVNQCFPLLDKVDLTVCKKQSIPKSFRQFYDDKFLKFSLQQCWRSQLQFRANKYSGNFNRALSRLLSDYPFLDFIIILYFRAVCLLAFKKYKDELKDYLHGDQENCIKTYGQQSEGVVLDICNRFFKINIEVFEVRKKEVKRPQAYINLLYFQNHYDLIQRNRTSEIKAEQSQMKKIKKKQKQQNFQFFSQISSSMIQGNCIQCSKEGNVFQQNGLCKACHQMSMSTLQNYAKDKLIRGKCAQCKFTCDDISQQFGLCKSCIKYQNYYTEKKQYKKIYCQMCNQQVAQIGKCLRCQQKKKYKYGYCVNCHDKQKINVQLGLCDFCIRIQQKYTDKIIQHNKSRRMTKCPRCNEQIKEGLDHQCRMKCQGCDRSSHVLNHLGLCHKCSQNIKDDKIQSKIKKQAIVKQKQKQQNNLRETAKKDQQVLKLTGSNLGNSSCQTCRKIVKDDPLIENMCKKCYDQNNLRKTQQEAKQEDKTVKKQVTNSSIQESKRQQNHKMLKCKKCEIIKHSFDLQDGLCKSCKKLFQTLYKKNSDQCKKCKKSGEKYLLTNGYCYQCNPYK